MHHYMNIISPGPLMIIRVPWPMPVWRKIVRATTPVMRTHLLYKKDIHAIEGLVPYPEDRDAKDIDFVARLDAAYDGAPNFAKFWLYDWSDFHDGTFRLVREARQAGR